MIYELHAIYSNRICRVLFANRKHNKRNDVIKMQIIEFSTRNDVIEMFESRFEFANTQMSQIIREQIEYQLFTFEQSHELKFAFQTLRSTIESTLHHQIAMNYAQTFCDESRDYVVNAIARNEHENATLFEIVETQSMKTIRTFEITNELQILNYE